MQEIQLVPHTTRPEDCFVFIPDKILPYLAHFTICITVNYYIKNIKQWNKTLNLRIFFRQWKKKYHCKKFYNCVN